jgi:hypothetical protein
VELVEVGTVPAQGAATVYQGEGTVAMAAGDELKIEAGSQLISQNVPVGKAWSLTVYVSVVETDA